MPDAARTALVLGATGLVGGHVLDLLLADPAWTRVLTLGRRPAARDSPRLEQRVAGFDRVDQHADAFGVDAVFCCLGTTIKAAGSQEEFRRVDHDYPLAAARLASGRGAPHFLIVTALGADAGSGVFYNRVKGEVERDVSALPFAGVTIARPSLILGERTGRRTAEGLAQKLAPVLNPLLLGPLRRYRAIPAESIARALVRLARKGSAGVRVVENDELAALGA
jgi:uncharacterized protein YbjT (DUF2867 family)